MRKITRLLSGFGALFLVLLFSACTVVKIDEKDAGGDDQYATWTKTGTGFQAAEYVEAIWDDQIIPLYEEHSVSFRTLVDALLSDRAAAIEQYALARESGEPYYVFKVNGTAIVVEYDDTSRNGVLRVDLEPADGTVDLTLQVGPVIRGTAIRDSAEFIRFTDIGNQLQFAELANKLNERMRRDSVDSIDLAALVGGKISFLGVFRLGASESLEEIVVTPVRIDVQQTGGQDG